MTLLEKVSRDVNRVPSVRMTEMYDGCYCPDEFTGMKHIPKPENCSSPRCIEVCEECWNREYVEQEGEKDMSEAEKKVLRERAQAMCEGEQRATLSGISTHLIYEELGRRLERQGVFIDSIGNIVNKHSEV